MTHMTLLEQRMHLAELDRIVSQPLRPARPTSWGLARLVAMCLSLGLLLMLV